MIIRCACRDDYQDGRWGPGMRMHEGAVWLPPVPYGVVWTCLTCGSQKSDIEVAIEKQQREYADEDRQVN